MFKKISLFLIAIISVIALVGCFNLEEVNSIEFVNFPQATYYKVEAADPKLNQAYETLLGEITIRITKKNTDPYTVTLKEAIEAGDVTVNFDASILTKTGTKTMVITLGSAKLTYVFNVVEEQLFARGNGTADSPYEIETVQQFLNIGTRFFGIPVPQSNDETAWKYYYQFSLPYLAGGKHYEIVKDLDFDGVNFTPLGYFGGSNFVPFTGKIIGNVNGNPAKIKNMNFENNNTAVDVCSLFAGANGSTFKDLIFENVNIDTQGKHGAALLSYNGVVGSKDYNVINNVKIESGLIKALRAGGIVCEGNNTFFLNCSNKADIYSFQHCGGGIFGRVTSRSYSYYQHKQIDGGSTLLAADIESVANTVVADNVRGFIKDCRNEGNIFGYTTDKNNSASGLGTANAAVYYENCSSTGTIASTQITHQLLHGTVYGPDLSNNTMVLANIGTTTLDYTDILDTDECYIEVIAQDGPNLAIALKVSKEAMKVYTKISLMYQQDGTANEQTEQDCLYVNNKWFVYGSNEEIEETKYFTLKSLKVEFIVIRKDTQGNVTSVRKASQTLTLIP